MVKIHRFVMLHVIPLKEKRDNVEILIIFFESQ